VVVLPGTDEVRLENLGCSEPGFVPFHHHQTTLLQRPMYQLFHTVCLG
jgi:hypothetical protein